MKTKKILLSISMLISGREEMKKSLDSLQAFKENIPCEIILVDTGCNKEQRQLAEQYADKIVNFTWCDDFAAARNAGLKLAEGEWFLYLDDDEWFEKPEQMLEFFKSGEYKKYKSARYVVRNYHNMQGTIYDDAVVARMVRLEPKTKFYGKIHEYIEPYQLPLKDFTDYVHHYGYVYQNEEDKKKHARRNIKPLQEMREAEPESWRWICQLSQEYFAIDEYEEVVKLCAAELEKRKKKGVGKNREDEIIQIGAIYGFLLISLESLARYEEEDYWLKEALAEFAMPNPTRAFFCFAGVRLYSKMKEYNKCRECLKRYIKYIDNIGQDKEALMQGTTLITAGVFEERLQYPALLMSMVSLIRLGDYSLAKDAFYRIDWSDKRMLCQNEEERKIVDACCSEAYNPLWAEMLQTLVSREDGMKEMYVVFLETEIAYKQQKQEEKLLKLRRLVAELEYEHRYILYAKILWTEKNPAITSEEDRKSEEEVLFQKLFSQYGKELLEIKTEIWNVAERLDIALEEEFLQIPYGTWQRMLQNWSREASVENIREWEMRIGSWKRQENIRYGLFEIKCMEGYIRCYGKMGIPMELQEQRFWQYAEKVLAFYGPYYKEFVFEETAEMIPEEAQLALGLMRLKEYREQKNDLKTLESARKCMGLYPELDETISVYAKSLRDEIERRNKEANSAAAELSAVIVSLKKAAKMYLQRGENAQAMEILQQIQKYSPYDSEVQEMLEQARN